MSSRGLPGFLRRTLRVDYEEDEEEDDNEVVAEGIHQRESSTTTTGSTSEDDNAARAAAEEEETRASHTSASRKSSSTFGSLAGAFRRATGTSSSATTSAAATSSSNDPSTGTGDLVESPSKDTSVPPTKVQLSHPKEETDRSDPELPKQPTAPQSYREVQFDKVMAADVINMAELRKLAWNGIPNRHRAQAWKILLGYLPTNRSRREGSLQRKRSEYLDAVAQHYDIDDDSRMAQEQETLRQVLVDVPRTAPEVGLFRSERIRRILSRLLYVWAMRHPASSYVQGINDLATPLLVVFLADYYQGEDVLDGHVMNHLSDERLDELEADVYWCLTNLLSGIQDHYTSDQPGVQRMVMRLEELVKRIDADLCQHLEEMGVQFLQFSFRWMNCLLLREFELKGVVRLWDTYISEKDGFEDFHVYVCAAFLCQFSPQLQVMSFDELLGFMQKIPTSDWTDTEVEMLLSQAFVLSTLFGGSDAHLTSGNGR